MLLSAVESDKSELLYYCKTNQATLDMLYRVLNPLKNRLLNWISSQSIEHKYQRFLFNRITASINNNYDIHGMI